MKEDTDLKCAKNRFYKETISRGLDQRHKVFQAAGLKQLFLDILLLFCPHHS